jgi:hypothetical protein
MAGFDNAAFDQLRRINSFISIKFLFSFDIITRVDVRAKL